MNRRRRAIPPFLKPIGRLSVFFRRHGFRRTARRVSEELQDSISRIRHGRSRYERWLLSQQHQSAADRRESDSQGPLISIVMPVCDPDPRWLQAAIDSVLSQHYPNWQLCLVDDASLDPSIRPILEAAVEADPRIELQLNSERKGISGTSNRALEVARGEYVALLDHDDELTPDALLLVARSARDQAFDILYTDEDKRTPRGNLRDPTFKPSRSRDLLHACMYFGHLSVYRRELLQTLGGFDSRFDGSQDHDLALRAEAIADRVVHLPSVLYHWRMAVGSAANPDENAKPWAYQAGRRAIEAELARHSVEARVVDGVAPGHARIIREVRADSSVSILHCSCCDAPRCVPDSRLVSEWIRIPCAAESGLDSVGARWNAAADQASGDFLIFLDGARPIDSAIEPTWLNELIAQLQRESVGAVGAQISSPTGELIHMGVVLGGSEVIRTQTAGLRTDEPGHLALAQSLRPVSSVAGGCFAVRRDLLFAQGGFDDAYRSALHDVDLCLQLRRGGRLVLYDPYVKCSVMTSHSGNTATSKNGLPRPTPSDIARLVEKWPRESSERDPFSNPNFHPNGAIFHPRYRPIMGR